MSYMGQNEKWSGDFLKNSKINIWKQKMKEIKGGEELNLCLYLDQNT